MGVSFFMFHGNLTRDPEEIGKSGCKMRVAVNQREKVNGEWADRANYFDLVIFGKRAESCLKYLSKGSEFVAKGHPRWSEYTDKTTGKKREAVSFFADEVDFVGGRKSDGLEAAKEFIGEGGAASGVDDDIPF